MTVNHILKDEHMTDDLNSYTPQARAMTEALDILRTAGLDAHLCIDSDADHTNPRYSISIRQASEPYDTLMTSVNQALYACLNAQQRDIAIATAMQRR